MGQSPIKIRHPFSYLVEISGRHVMSRDHYRPYSEYHQQYVSIYIYIYSSHYIACLVTMVWINIILVELSDKSVILESRHQGGGCT